MKLDPNKVRLLQSHLRTKGYNIAVDGAHGPATLDATLHVLGLTVAAAPRAIPNPAGMKTSDEGVALIHSFETCELKAYPDPGSRDGKPVTNGWGSTTDMDGRPIRLGAVWTQEYADAKFRQDLARFERAVNKAVAGTATTQNQFDALVCFTYNLGEGNLNSSTLLKKHRAGDYAGAKDEFARWNKNDGKEMRGLTRRREAEAELYEKAE